MNNDTTPKKQPIGDEPEEVSAEEELQAERHVTELMGPAQPLDGSKPKPVSVYEPTETQPPSTDADSLEDQTPKKESQEPANIEDSVSASELAGAPSLNETSNQLEQAEEVAKEPVEQVDVRGEANEDIVAVNKKLEAQVHGEADLDLSELPSDFNATGAAETDLDKKGLHQTLKDHLNGDDEPVDTQPLKAAAPVVMKQNIFTRFKNAFLAWWYNPWKRYITLGVIFVILGVVFGVPSLRATVLNAAGVRSSVMMVATDSTNNLPLENVTLSVDGVKGKTDDDGKVRLRGVTLGEQVVTISKPGFKTVEKKTVIGLRVVDLGDITLKATGLQLTFNLTDYLSKKGLTSGSVESGEATAKADKKGVAILTVPTGTSNVVEVTIKAESYRDEKVEVAVERTEPTTIAMVPSTPVVYVSKETGVYSVYRIDADQKNKEVILEGTGNETSDVQVMTDPTGTYAAVASTRDGTRNKDGYLLSNLTLVTLKDGSSEPLGEQSEQYQLIGWRGKTLIYQQVMAGVSAANSSRQKIFASDVETGKRYQLANANYFSGVQLIGKKLYFVVSSTDPNEQGSLSVVDLSGENRKVLFKNTIWSMVRTGYQSILLQTADNKWYEYKTTNPEVKEAKSPPSYASRYYIENPKGTGSAWVDERDRLGVVQFYDVETAKDGELTSIRNATRVVGWLSDTVMVVRVASSTMDADYVLSVDGGEARYVTDVSPLRGYGF